MSAYSHEDESHTNSIPKQTQAHNSKPREGEEEQITKKALEIARGITLPMVLKSSMELGILDILSDASDRGAYLSAYEVAREIQGCVNPSAPDILDRMLGLLTSYSILRCKMRSKGKNGQGEEGGVEKVYEVAPFGKCFLTKKVGLQGSLGPLLILNHNKVAFDIWNHLNDALLEGGTPFEKAYGSTAPFEYLGKDSKLNNLFNRAMSNYSVIIMNKILDVYRGFEGINVLVDVGGGVGANLNLITSQYPNIKGINFDLPHVVVEAYTTNPGLEHVGGDMFEKVPNGDAIFMKWILHNWSDEHCLKLLNNCWKALPENGKVIVLEKILPLVPENNYESQRAFDEDLCMFICLGGKERTREEFQALAFQSGFSGFRVICSVYGNWIVEFHKTTAGQEG